MKITKIPGFGNYGAIVEDFDWADPAAYQELKELNLKSLVTIVRGDGVNRFDSVAKLYNKVSTPRLPGSRWLVKYGVNWQDSLTQEEKDIVETTLGWTVGEKYPGWLRVTGKKTDDYKTMGLFGETELLWHNDDSGDINFSPLVSLYGAEHTNTSATCFIQTADWYEKQTETFKSELDQLVAIYNWDNDKIQPGADYINEQVVRSNLVPVENGQLPLIMTSAGGIKGLYFSDFITRFVGMSEEESQKLLARIRSEIMVPEYRYDYWWEHECGDMVLMDQTLTLHCRQIKPGLDLKEELSKRIVYRLVGDYAGMLDYTPYSQKEFSDVRLQSMEFITKNAKSPHDLPAWQLHVAPMLPLNKGQRFQYMKDNVPEAQRTELFKYIMCLEANNG